jgi:hypothetical protein
MSQFRIQCRHFTSIIIIFYYHLSLHVVTTNNFACFIMTYLTGYIDSIPYFDRLGITIFFFLWHTKILGFLVDCHSLLCVLIFQHGGGCNQTSEESPTPDGKFDSSETETEQELKQKNVEAANQSMTTVVRT